MKENIIVFAFQNTQHICLLTTILFFALAENGQQGAL